VKTFDTSPIAWASGILTQLRKDTLLVLLLSQVAWAGSSESGADVLYVRCKIGDLFGSSDSQQQALSCFREAADRGDKGAQGVLGVAYWTGNGVAQDPVEAYKWLILAIGKDEDAAGELKKYEWQMTPEQVAKARVAARTWTGAHAR
jgi:TPR repeat protein